MASMFEVLCLLTVALHPIMATLQFRSSMQLNADQEMNTKALTDEAISDLKEAVDLLQEAFAASPSAVAGFANNTHHNSSKAVAPNQSQEVKASSNGSMVPKHNSSVNLKTEQDALQKLFTHLKSNIASINKNEDSNKAHVKEVIERLQKRYQQDKDRLNSTNLSSFEHERLVNRTRSEEAELKYWSRSRELQHGMFHANLKMSHGLMSRVKQVMEAYKDVLTKGKLDPKVAQALKSVSASLPKALF